MTKTTVSVVTPTIRKDGLDIVKKGLDRQTIDYKEWLIGSSFDPEIGTWVKDDFKEGWYSLNRINNKLVKESTGDLIVFIQDYTFVNPEALEKFVFYYEKDPNMIVSGVGDKYSEVYPETGTKLWVDPRRPVGSGECVFHYIEGNFCAYPRKAIIDMGGWGENLDFIGYNLDHYSLLDRMNITGKYKFFMDTTNESYSLVHGRVDNWDSDGISTNMYKEIRKDYLKNPILSYLS